MDDKEKIRAIVKEVNDVTLGSKQTDLQQFFHDEVKFVAPDFKNVLEGREKALDSYREFREMAEVKSYELGEPDISIFDTTAIATYSFDMRYKLGQESYHEGGRDLMVLIKRDEQWKIAWRTLITLSSETE